jgi:hypothetical protein
MSVTRTGNWRDELEEMNFHNSSIKITTDPMLVRLFRTTIDRWGYDPQVLTASEEAMEYAMATLRLVARPWDGDANIDRLIDETADLTMMLAQMHHIMIDLGPADWTERVLDRIKFKADRLRHRLLKSVKMED